LRDLSRKVSFRPLAAIPFDVRTMSFKGLDRVSLLTLAGRILVPMLVGRYQAERIPRAKGQCDLVSRKGKWFLFVTIDVPEGSPTDPDDFLGVDLGVEEIATDSDGNRHSGSDVEDVRRKHNLQRKRLQRRGTKGSRKKLKRVSGKEARFRRHKNHVISKRIVESAKGTGRGIAVEDLRIRAGLAASAGIARSPTGRADPNSAARHATTSSMPTRTPPGTSGLWLSLSEPQDWQASRLSRKSHTL